MPGIAVWHDYFFMVGGGAAALTGLVFVAMTLHLKEIAGQPVHRHRARTILTGFTAVFARCGLVLMGGQSRQAVAAELVLVVAGVEVILLRSIRDAAPAASTGVAGRLPPSGSRCAAGSLRRRAAGRARGPPGDTSA